MRSTAIVLPVECEELLYGRTPAENGHGRLRPPPPTREGNDNDNEGKDKLQRKEGGREERKKERERERETIIGMWGYMPPPCQYLHFYLVI